MPTQSPADGQRSFSSAESSEPVCELKKRLRYTQSVEIDEEELLCEMENSGGGYCYGEAQSFERGYPQRVFE